MKLKPIYIREVWASNLEKEFKKIESVIDDFPFITIDTEFSGAVFDTVNGRGFYDTPGGQEFYNFIKANVERMKLIQFGVTFTDAQGNLPDLGSHNCHIWQFNFSGFDVKSDPHVPASITMLKNAGIDLDKFKADGVDSVEFAKLLISSGMVSNNSVTWIAFQGNYDFALLLQILKPEPLPDELSRFSEKMKPFFCNFYDIKHMIRVDNTMPGGLGSLTKRLGVEREVGTKHQAGSDSLVAWRVFKKVWSLYFMAQGSLEEQADVLYKFGS